MIFLYTYISFNLHCLSRVPLCLQYELSIDFVKSKLIGLEDKIKRTSKKPNKT